MSAKPKTAMPGNRPRGGLGAPVAKQNNFVGQPSTSYNIQAIKNKFKTESAIPLSKKKEYEVTHMQRNTLLEPNNFIPSWEGGGEEKREVSNTLKKLRKNFDNVHKKVEEKKIYLEKLKRRL